MGCDSELSWRDHRPQPQTPEQKAKQEKNLALLDEIRKFYDGSWTKMICPICGVGVPGNAVERKYLKRHMRWHQKNGEN